MARHAALPLAEAPRAPRGVPCQQVSWPHVATVIDPRCSLFILLRYLSVTRGVICDMPHEWFWGVVYRSFTRDSKHFLRSHLECREAALVRFEASRSCASASSTLSLSSYTDPGHHDSLAPARTRFLATQPQQSTPTAIQSTSAPPPPPASPPRRSEAQMAHDVWLSDES